jgi:hypothetical protein
MSSESLRLAPTGFKSVLNGKIAERVFRLNLGGLNAKFENVCDRMVITVYQSVEGLRQNGSGNRIYLRRGF